MPVSGIASSISPRTTAPYSSSDMEGFTNSEVAEILGVSLDVVKIRLHRARARLRKDIEMYCPPAEWVPDE